MDLVEDQRGRTSFAPTGSLKGKVQASGSGPKITIEFQLLPDALHPISTKGRAALF